MWLWKLAFISPPRGAYDTHRGFVIRADSEEAARIMADETAVDDWHHDHPWLDPKQTYCSALDPDGECEIILRDFLHG